MFAAPQAGAIRAVDGIDLTIRRGETLGLVGESGCGKSTVGRLLLRLLRPSAGSIRFGGVDIATLEGAALRAVRSRAQMIFQDPFGSLNPRMRVSESDQRTAAHRQAHAPEPDLRARALDLMQSVGPGRAPRRSLSARVLRRPAPAHRHRPRAGARARADRRRRAGLGARRVDPGAGDQPDAGPAGALRPDLPVHLARPGRGAPHRATASR